MCNSCVCVCVVVQEVEGVSGERDQLKALAEELGRELHQSKAQVGELRTETEYLNTQLEVCINCMKMYWLWVYIHTTVFPYVHLENTDFMSNQFSNLPSIACCMFMVQTYVHFKQKSSAILYTIPCCSSMYRYPLSLSIRTGGEAVSGAAGRPGGQGQRREADSRKETGISREGGSHCASVYKTSGG